MPVKRALPPKAIGPVWVLRWLGPYGTAYIGFNSEVIDEDWRRHVVLSAREATLYPTGDAAESAAVVLSAKYPESFLGKLSPREWDGRKVRP